MISIIKNSFSKQKMESAISSLSIPPATGCRAYPQHTIIGGLDVTCKAGFYLNVTYNYTDPIYLNDANIDRATSFNLIGARLGYRKNFKKIRMELFAGGDNLTDTRYSLGNDINAAAGRYYNAAPGRNYYAGVSLTHLGAGNASGH